MIPEGHMIVCVNRDLPGVVGTVGALLGGAGINIAGMQLGRDVPGGRALFVLTVDEKPTKEIHDDLQGLDVIERVDLVNL